jgi:hypothetical protein
MTATPIRPTVKNSVAKQQMIDYVAQKFDQFTDDTGNEPEGIQFNLVHSNGDTSVSWIFPTMDECPGVLLDRCCMSLMRQIVGS